MRPRRQGPRPAREAGYWTERERAEYARQARMAGARIGALEGQALRAVRGLLEDVRGQVIERLVWAQERADAGGSTYDLARLSALQQEIGEVFVDLRLRFPETARELAEKVASLSAEAVDVPLRLAAGADALAPFGLSRSIASASALVQASLVTRVSHETARAISSEIALAATGLKTPFEVLQSVGRNLDDPSIFGTIAARAETIVRTELGRVNSVAGQARLEEAAQTVHALQKQWVHAGRPDEPRASHLAAHGQVVDVEDAFLVGGERLRFPRDPAGSPGNTINCGCGSVPYIPGLSDELAAAA